MTTPRLILASSSAQRRALLAGAGYCFEVAQPPLPEPAHRPRECDPAAWAVSLAYFKARALNDVAALDKAVVLAADTIVIVGDEVLGKPSDEAEARRMLTRQAGVPSRVITGIALLANSQRRLSQVSTWVWMRDDAELRESYIRSGDWRGKAGAYGIQDVGDQLVERIEGSFSNVVGLPMEHITGLLKSAGIAQQRAEAADLRNPPGAPGGVW